MYAGNLIDSLILGADEVLARSQSAITSITCEYEAESPRYSGLTTRCNRPVAGTDLKSELAMCAYHLEVVR